MPAAAEEAPVGNHHVLAIKKYELMKVISQMTTRSTRPMQRDLRVWILGRPHYGCAYNPWSQISGAAIDASLPQPTPCASAFFFFGVRRSCRRFYGRAASRQLSRPARNQNHLHTSIDVFLH